MTLWSARDALGAASPRVAQALGLGSGLGGEKAPLASEEAVGRDAQGGVVVEAAPAPPLVVVEPQLLLELPVIPLDPPARLGGRDQLLEAGRLGQGGEPVPGRLLLRLRPLDQQPLLRVRLGAPVVAVRRAHPHGGEAPAQLAPAPLAPARRPPGVRRQ